LVHKRCGCSSSIVLCFIFFGLVILFASTIDIKSAFATTTPIQANVCTPDGRCTFANRCFSGLPPSNVLYVATPDSRRAGCSYSYVDKPCDEIWGSKICGQSNDPYNRSPNSMHIVVTVEFHHMIDRSTLRPLMPQGSPDATVALFTSRNVIPIDILPIQCIDMNRCRGPTVLFEIRTLKPWTDPDVLGLCGAESFFLRLGQVRDMKGSILDGDYNGVPGGDYLMRFSPPPC
jgi:hypothetical protein